MVNYDMLEAIVRGTRGVREEDRPHASRGGRAYPKEVREMVIEMMLTGGIAAVKTPVVNQLRQQKKSPHFRLVGGGYGNMLCLTCVTKACKWQ